MYVGLPDSPTEVVTLWRGPEQDFPLTAVSDDLGVVRNGNVQYYSNLLLPFV